MPSDATSMEFEDEKSSQDEGIHSTPIVNTDGIVCIERRIQQRIDIMPVLSYQMRKHARVAQATSPSKFTLLLSGASIEMSKRAKEIAM